jgi:hypothetical protein
VLPARLAALMLGWTDLFLFRHGEMESIVGRRPDACAVSPKNRKILQKNAFWPLTVLFR